MTQTLLDTHADTSEPAHAAAAGTRSVACPHCHKSFVAQVDADQPLRLQGAKCPHCRLFVPIRLILES